MKTVGIAAAMLVSAMAVPASADTYSFTLSSSLGAGTGSFTTAGSGPATSQILSLDGLFNGNSISLLAPGAYPVGAANDNLFTPAAPFFTFNGLSFSANSQNFNLYNDGGLVRLCGVTAACANATAGSTIFTATLVPAAAAVPEPATWGMMLLGFAAMGVAIRRRAKVRTNVSFA